MLVTHGKHTSGSLIYQWAVKCIGTPLCRLYPLPDLVPYCLRHEYCTELARQGSDIRIAQKLMGHSDIKLTANIYTNFNSDDVLTAAKILAKRQ